MLTRNVVYRNSYHDSVYLMALAGRVKALPGVADASCVMGAAENLKIVEAAGLLTEAGRGAGPSDLVFCIRAESEAAFAAAEADLVAALAQPRASTSGTGEYAPRTLESAVGQLPGANLALVSVPGRYAAREARKALDKGLNVFLFSDNVPLEDEVRLKELARTRGLLVMGPDCGTALIDGAAVGFANVVRRGDIGIVAAAGTGLQEVACLIDRGRAGVSQAIGTGGRDVKAAVGGITMLSALRRLDEDPETRVVCVVSKPPAEEVAAAVLSALEKSAKPSIVAFLGRRGPVAAAEQVHHATTLAEAAAVAVALSRGEPVPARMSGVDAETLSLAEAAIARLPARRKYVRGLFSGGTLCYEALVLLARQLGEVWSNTPLDEKLRVRDTRSSRGHCVLDLGDDELTVGRPHPMIDHRLRNERIVQEVADHETAVLLLDVVLGFGAHPNPAGAMAGALKEAVAAGVPVVASICGTRADPQGFDWQKTALTELGVTVLPSNARAVKFAALVASRGRMEAVE